MSPEGTNTENCNFKQFHFRDTRRVIFKQQLQTELPRAVAGRPRPLSLNIKQNLTYPLISSHPQRKTLAVEPFLASVFKVAI